MDSFDNDNERDLLTEKIDMLMVYYGLLNDTRVNHPDDRRCIDFAIRTCLKNADITQPSFSITEVPRVRHQEMEDSINELKNRLAKYKTPRIKLNLNGPVPVYKTRDISLNGCYIAYLFDGYIVISNSTGNTEVHHRGQELGYIVDVDFNAIPELELNRE